MCEYLPNLFKIILLKVNNLQNHKSKTSIVIQKNDEEEKYGAGGMPLWLRALTFSCKGHGFDSEHPHGSSQQYVTPVHGSDTLF